MNARATLRVLTGVLAALVVSELLLQALPVSSATQMGYHTHPDILTYPPAHHWTVSTGWDLRNAQRLTSNNAGFLASRDFAPHPEAVALIGDSYVESSMLDEADRPGQQLQSLLGPGRPVYAMGSPGSSLLDYATRVRFAHERYALKRFVLLLETGDLRQSVCGSGQIHAHCLKSESLQASEERIAAPSLAKQVFRHSALAQYALSQLKVQPSTLMRSLFSRSVPHDGAALAGKSPSTAVPPDEAEKQRTQKLVDEVVARFFESIGSVRAEWMVILLDGKREGLAFRSPIQDLERTLILQRLRSRGAQVVDLEAVYVEHSRHSKRSLSVGPYDRHLNALGVKLAMQAAADGLPR